MLKSAQHQTARKKADRKSPEKDDDDDDENAKNYTRGEAFALLFLPPATSRGGGVPPSVFFVVVVATRNASHSLFGGDPFRARESETQHQIERHRHGTRVAHSVRTKSDAVRRRDGMAGTARGERSDATETGAGI